MTCHLRRCVLPATARRVSAATSLLIALTATGPAIAADRLAVASIQMQVRPDIDRNLAAILERLDDAAGRRARVVVFPECALCGFDREYALSLPAAKLAEGRERIAAAAREHEVWVIYGTITPSGRERPYNTAIVVGPDGVETHCYHKMHPEGWFEPGDRLSLFEIDGVPCTMVICHDQRYPELVRIPVLAGARVCFSPAFEVNGLDAALRKADGYRAQVVARAVENTIWFVESNAWGSPGDDPRRLSLGDSRIVSPGGEVVAEATPMRDWIGLHELEIGRASHGNARRSLDDRVLADWWRQGIDRLHHPPRSGGDTPDEEATRDEGEAHRLRIGLMRGGKPVKWDLERNFATFLRVASEAAAREVDLLVTPEGWLDGYASPDPASTRERLRREVAQPLHGSPYLERVRTLAVDSKMHILFCFTLRAGPKLYNTAALWAPDGHLVGLYHKTHLQGHDLQFDPGPSLPVFSTPWGPLGVMICADRRWPETARTLRLKGARLILNPSYGMHHEANRRWMQTRGYENQCWIAFTHPQQSLLIAPNGEVAGREDGDEPGLLVRMVDLRRAKDDNHIRDRRPELYDPITR